MASAVNATPAGAPARLARYWDQLREASASLNTDGGRRQSLGSPGFEEASAFEHVRCQMKRSKFAFCDADLKISFNKGCSESVAPWGSVDTSHQRRLQDAKQQNKDFKSKLVQEEKAQERLMAALAEASAEAQSAHDACTRDLEELAFSQRDLSDIGVDIVPPAGEGEDLDLCPSWRGGPHSQAAEEARQGAVELSRVMSQGAAECRRRSQLEAEVARLQDEVRRKQAQTAAFGKQQEDARRLAENLEKLCEAERTFGLPGITFDDSQGTVTLEGAGTPGGSVDLALRTLAVEFAQNGALARAEPHPQLGLQREAAEAVRRDDLPGLLTVAWRRLCEGAQPERSRRPSRGGA